MNSARARAGRPFCGGRVVHSRHLCSEGRPDMVVMGYALTTLVLAFLWAVVAGLIL